MKHKCGCITTKLENDSDEEIVLIKLCKKHKHNGKHIWIALQHKEQYSEISSRGNSVEWEKSQKIEDRVWCFFSIIFYTLSVTTIFYFFKFLIGIIL